MPPRTRPANTLVFFNAKYVSIEFMKYSIRNKEDMEKVVKDFASSLVPKDGGAMVVGLYGNLGAGKTFLTQVLAKNLGINEQIVSPTFVIEKIYSLENNKFSHLIHIDAYRLEKSEELLNLGWQNIISDPKNLILIEWPEKVEDIMPEHTKIFIKYGQNENSREIEVVV